MTMSTDQILYFGVAPLRVDIMTAADGINVAEALTRVCSAKVGTLKVPILSLDI